MAYLQSLKKALAHHGGHGGVHRGQRLYERLRRAVPAAAGACSVRAGCLAARAGAGRSGGRKALRPFADGLVCIRHAGVCGVQRTGQRMGGLLAAVAFGCRGAGRALGKAQAAACSPARAGQAWRRLAVCGCAVPAGAVLCGRRASLRPARYRGRRRDAPAGFFLERGQCAKLSSGVSPAGSALFRLYPDLSLSFGIDGCGPLHGERNALL